MYVTENSIVLYNNANKCSNYYGMLIPIHLSAGGLATCCRNNHSLRETTLYLCTDTKHALSADNGSIPIHYLLIICFRVLLSLNSKFINLCQKKLLLYSAVNLLKMLTFNFPPPRIAWRTRIWNENTHHQTKLFVSNLSCIIKTAMFLFIYERAKFSHRLHRREHKCYANRVSNSI